MHSQLELFIDESGDLGLSRRSSRHFIVVAVAIRDSIEFRRLLKRVQRAQYHHVDNPIEFKFHSSPDRLRSAVCAGIARSGAMVSWRGVSKESSYGSCWNDKQGLYIDLCRDALTAILLRTRAKSVHVALDKWSNDRSVRRRIDEALIGAIGVSHQGYFPPSVRVSHLDATRSYGIQVADFVAGAVFQSVERSDGSYLQMLSERVVDGRLV
jgi:hypothetical protein